ncbi:MAG: family 1 glycosylhydrolase [Microbacteriaceae bacterium]|nr:family 1 glycosylhydrolase [Microbacteriaceae bacterium]
MISEWLHDPAGLAALVPAHFTIGAQTSAFQVEGAVRDDGREPSTWDIFMAQPGRISDDSYAAITADHYHRFGDDLRFMRELGIDSYRFSLGWPRLQPAGRGAANRAAVAFYDRLLDGLLAVGIRPMLTLHHFDLPEPLQHVGGWLNRDTASRLADFAYLAATTFGDRVDSWVTLSEPVTAMIEGYAVGSHAPGASLKMGALAVVHNQLLGHGLAVEALRAADVSGRIGIANLHTPVEPSSDRREDVDQAELFDLIHNRLYADPILLGRYPDAPEETPDVFSLFREIEPSELRTISQPLDFYGLSYSGPTRIRSSSAAGGLAATGLSVTGSRASGSPAARFSAPGFPFVAAPWPEFATTGDGTPDAPVFLAAALAELGARYGEALPPVVITSVGASCADVVDVEGAINDEARTAYLAEHLAVAFAATSAAIAAPGATGVSGSTGAARVAVSGLYVRSLLDGWEWARGYETPYGLLHVNSRTQDRTPKRSYRWLQQLLGER